MVGAGLERHVHRRARRVRAPAAAILDRGDLGVDAAQLGMMALADHLSVSHENGADDRIGADPSAPQLRKLQGTAKLRAVLVGDEV